mgnify:CR=1 FL=1
MVAVGLSSSRLWWCLSGQFWAAVSIYYVLGWDNIRRELDEGRKKPVSRAFGQTAKLVYVPLTVLILILGFIYKGIG